MPNIQHRVIDLLAASPRPLLSVEFFPPKSEDAVDSLVASAAELLPMRPDFVSVTYGAGGSTRDRSARVSAAMKDEIGLNVMPHFTCVGATKEELGESIDRFHAEGYRNIMALRGDPPKDQNAFVATKGGFKHANELVAYIRERYPDICIGVAGYPEKHPEAASMDSDLDRLKAKVDAGASFITTQLFFENRHYYDFVEKARARGIELPIFPGLMPVLATAQIRRIASMCGSTLPARLECLLADAGDSPEAVRAVGSAWAAEQLDDLLSQGVPGAHLYALNNADIALRLMAVFRQRAA